MENSEADRPRTVGGLNFDVDQSHSPPPLQIVVSETRETSDMAVQNEPLHDIAHLGSVELLTPKPDKSLWYFRDILGMEPVHESGGSVYLRGYGDYATSTLKLTAAKNAGVGCVSWRATSAQGLARRARVLEAAGLGIGWTNGDFRRGGAFW